MLVKLNTDSNPVFNFQTNQPQQPYIGSSVILGQAPTQNTIDISSWGWNGSSWNKNWSSQIASNDAFLSSVDDQILLADFTDQRINISTGMLQNSLPTAQQRSEQLNGQFSVLKNGSLNLQPSGETIDISNSNDRLYTGAVQLSKNQPAFYLLSENRLQVFEPNSFTDPKTIVQNTSLGWPAFADINDDGGIDFIYVNKQNNAVEARNINGAMLPHFPISPPEGSSFTGTPLIVQTDQVGKQIFITSQDSLSMNIQAYTIQGEKVRGFPIYAGAVSKKSNEPVHPLIYGRILYAVSHRGELNAWNINNITDVVWGSRYGNAQNNKITGRLSASVGSPNTPNQVLVKQETYNWPNPVQDHTNLRFQTSGPGSVDVKIITTNGSVVFEKRYQSQGSAPEEHRISTQNWNNGLYFAMVTANVDGQTARKMLKIVVIQ